MSRYHTPVLLQESVKALNILPGKTYLDLTFGGGGHSAEILKNIDNTGKLLAFDQDAAAEKNAESFPQENFQFIKANFRYLKKFLKLYGQGKVGGILADLGISSHQIDQADRGFSTRESAPLDMRMDKGSGKSAWQVVNNSSASQLAQMLKTYGEVPNAWQLAQAIVLERGKKNIDTTGELVNLLSGFARKGKEYKYYAQVFQAIRIEVNEELEALKEMLQQSADVLEPGGRLVVIAYHSLEDRLVKNFMRSGKFAGEVEKDFYGNPLRPLKPLASKPIIPTTTEIAANRRARSARLRVAART